MLVREYQKITQKRIDEGFDFIIPLELFPNHMGINLNSVDGFEITKIGDRLIDVTIKFIPDLEIIKKSLDYDQNNTCQSEDSIKEFNISQEKAVEDFINLIFGKR